MFHKSEILKNAVSERWCSDSRLILEYIEGACDKISFCKLDFHVKWSPICEFVYHDTVKMGLLTIKALFY